MLNISIYVTPPIRPLGTTMPDFVVVFSITCLIKLVVNLIVRSLSFSLDCVASWCFNNKFFFSIYFSLSLFFSFDFDLF